MYHVPNRLVHGGITGKVIGAAMEVHKQLGAGFLESVYEEALAREFEVQKIGFERQRVLPIAYKDKVIKEFVCDFLVDEKVLVEVKAIKTITEIEKLQVVNYLRASGVEVGLLVNFGAKSLEFKRLISTDENKQ